MSTTRQMIRMVKEISRLNKLLKKRRKFKARRRRKLSFRIVKTIQTINKICKKVSQTSADFIELRHLIVSKKRFKELSSIDYEEEIGEVTIEKKEITEFGNFFILNEELTKEVTESMGKKPKYNSSLSLVIIPKILKNLCKLLRKEETGQRQMNKHLRIIHIIRHIYQISAQILYDIGF